MKLTLLGTPERDGEREEAAHEPLTLGSIDVRSLRRESTVAWPAFESVVELGRWRIAATLFWMAWS